MASFSKLFTQTLHDAPAEADTPGFQFLLRAGYIAAVGNANYALLPLACRCFNNLQTYLIQIAENFPALQVQFPAATISAEMEHSQLKSVINKVIRSHRQLPVTIYYQTSIKSDSPHSKVGLLASRESLVISLCSLSASPVEQQTHLQSHAAILNNFFHYCQLPIQATNYYQSEADQGISFFLQDDSGEDQFLKCAQCSTSHPAETAKFSRELPSSTVKLPVTPVNTPEASSIQALATYLQIPASQTAKAVLWMATLPEKNKPVFLFLIVRGDMEVSPAKVTGLLKCDHIQPATDEQIRAIGAEPGYASPIGLQPREDLLIIVDEAIPLSPNLVAGANQAGYHLLNTNYGRDYSAQLVADIALASDGAACPKCNTPQQMLHGMKVATIQQLENMGCEFQDAAGQNQPVHFLTSTINLTRVLGCLAEVHHDQTGLTFPASIAPYAVHVIVLPGKTIDTSALASEICDQLRNSNFDTVVDDRTESAGVKFNDADLIGLPIRLTISERSLQSGGVEYKLRSNPEKKIVPIVDLLQQIQKDLSDE